MDTFTDEMLWDYFPWTNLSKHPQMYPAGHPMYQPENLTLNESVGINKLLSKIGINVKV